MIFTAPSQETNRAISDRKSRHVQGSYIVVVMWGWSYGQISADTTGARVVVVRSGGHREARIPTFGLTGSAV